VPQRIDVAEPLVQEDEVEWTVADDLVTDMDVAAASV